MDSPHPTAVRKPGLMCRLATELQRLVIVAVIVGLVLVAGKYYGFDRLDEEIRGRFETQLREHYRGLVVSVQAARRIPGRGVEFRGIRIAAPGREETLLVEVDELLAECDTRLPDFLTQPPAVKAVEVKRLKLRAERLPSGQWNLAGLLPMPQCGKGAAPRATISEASIEFVDATQQPPCSWTLRNISLTVTPQTESTDGAVPEGGATPRGRESIAAGVMHDGKYTPQLTPDPVRPTTLALHGSVAGDHFEKLEFDATLDPHSGAWDLRGEVSGLEFSPRLRAALPRELARAVAPLASIRGRTHFGFHARREAPPAGQIHLPPVQFAIQGDISEGRIDDTRLPEPLTDVVAKVRFDNRGLRIDELSAKCGTTSLKLNASATGYERGSPLELQIDARQVPLERLPLSALPAEVQAAFQRFSPRGLVDVEGHLAFDGRRWLPDLTIRCRELSIQYVSFPYRASEGTGTIELKPDAVTVRLRMIGGGQVIQCRADVRDPGQNFTGWIDVQSEGPVPIDDKLLAAMEPAAQRVVRAFHPRGAASFQARFYRDASDPQLHRKLSVNLHDCSIQHDKFRYPIDKVSGSLQLSDGGWVFRNLSGRNDSAAIVGEGSWQDEPQAGRVLRLQFAATDVPLAEELRQALSPQMQRLWSNLRPRGNLDHLAVGLRYEARLERLSVDIAADKLPQSQGGEGRALSIEPSWFRYRLDNLTGNFRYQDGVMQLTNLQATHNRTTLSGEAACRVQDDGVCRLDFMRLAADRIEVDQDLVAAMPARMGEAIGRLSLQGPLNLIGSLGITVPPQADAAPALDWDFSLDLENGRLAASQPIEHIHGTARLIGGSGASGMACRGELLVDSAIVRGVQFTQIEGPLWTNGEQLVFGANADLDAKGRRPRPLSANVFGGHILAGGEASLAGDGRFHLTANLEEADLAEIVRQLAPHQRGLSGKVFAAAGLSGTTAGMHTWRGGGQVRLRDADIYELPVMIALLKLLSVQQADRTAFTTSDIDFRVEGDDLAFERINFNGDAVSLRGKGRMNGQREIDLKFHPLVGREERFIPLVRPLVGETGRQFMLIEVTGQLDQPQVKRTVFPKLDEQLEQLFPELARDELMQPAKPLLSLPQATLQRLNLLPKR